MEPSLRLVLVLCFLVLPSVISADTNTDDSMSWFRSTSIYNTLFACEPAIQQCFSLATNQHQPARNHPANRVIVHSFILHYQVLFSLYLCSIWPSCDGAFLGQAASKLVRQWPLWRKLDRDSLHWEPGHVDVSICNIYVYISPRTFFLNRRWQIVLLLFSFDGCLMFCRKLGNLELSGTLSGDIQFIQELQHLYVNSSLGSLST
jgi:hypothetical protein